MTLVLAVILPILFAVVGGLLAGNAVKDWYPILKKPAYSISIPVFMVVGFIYYIICGFILYRLLTQTGSERTLSLVLLLGMMAFNEIWNYLFFGLKSPLIGFISLVIYTGVAVALYFSLRVADVTASYALIPYLLWLLYDIAWIYGIWRMNPV